MGPLSGPTRAPAVVNAREAVLESGAYSTGERQLEMPEDGATVIETEVGFTEVSRTLQEPVAKGLGDKLGDEALQQHVKSGQWICKQTARAWHMCCSPIPSLPLCFLGV